MKTGDPMEKNQWQQPLLVVLARSKAEETVLHPCKHLTTGFGSGASGTVNQCRTTDTNGVCLLTGCEDISLS
jgi:hypothetical protein